MCGADQDVAGRGARSADPCGRGRDAAAEARRGCADAPAPREGAVPRAAAAAAARRRGAARSCSGATSTRRSPPRWRGSSSDAQAARARRRRSRIAVVAPASPFARDEFDARLAELRALGFEPVYDETSSRGGATSPAPPSPRAAAFERRWADPSIAGVIARPRRLRQRAAAAAARSRRGRSARAEGVHRLQRQHVAPDRG